MEVSRQASGASAALPQVSFSLEFFETSPSGRRTAEGLHIPDFRSRSDRSGSGPRSRGSTVSAEVTYHCFSVNCSCPVPQMKTKAIGSPGEEAPPSLRAGLSPSTPADTRYIEILGLAEADAITEWPHPRKDRGGMVRMVVAGRGWRWGFAF